MAPLDSPETTTAETYVLSPHSILLLFPYSPTPSLRLYTPPSNIPSHTPGLRIIDTTISTIESSLAKAGYTSKPIVRWREEMPTEAEMVPKDKYTVFDRKEKRYRKSIRSMYIPI